MGSPGMMSNMSSRADPGSPSSLYHWTTLYTRPSSVENVNVNSKRNARICRRTYNAFRVIFKTKMIVKEEKRTSSGLYIGDVEYDNDTDWDYRTFNNVMICRRYLFAVMG